MGCSQGDFRARFSQRTNGSAGVTTRPGVLRMAGLAEEEPALGQQAGRLRGQRQ
nr:hypothetical protein [uncultured bacterium]